MWYCEAYDHNGDLLGKGIYDNKDWFKSMYSEAVSFKFKNLI